MTSPDRTEIARLDSEIARLRRLLRSDHANNCTALTEDVVCDCGWNDPALPVNHVEKLESLVAELRAALAEALNGWSRNMYSGGKLRDDTQTLEQFARCSDLRKLVTSTYGGVLRPDLATRYDRMSDAVLALIMTWDDATIVGIVDRLRPHIEALRGLVAE